MKMMKRIYILLAALLAVFACNRAEMPSSEVSSDFGEGLSFKASFSGATRSHFNASDDGTPDAGTLYWDESDKVGVISILMYDGDRTWLETYSDLLNENMEAVSAAKRSDWREAYANYGVTGALVDAPATKYITTALGKVSDISADGRSATISFPLAKNKWFANADEVTNPYYQFIAVYPMQSAPEFRCMYWEVVNEGGENDRDELVVGIPVSVAPRQTSSLYGTYQVCLDMGYDMNAFPESIGCYSRENLLTDPDASVVFDDMTPLTAMLRFKIATDYEGGESRVIDHIIVTTDAGDAMLSGTSYVGAYGTHTFIYPDRWNSNSYDYVRLDNVGYDTNNPTDDYYYLSVLPSYKGTSIKEAPEACNRYGGENVIFKAYDAYDNLIFESSKPMRENGFEPGKRYDFTLNLYSDPLTPLCFEAEETGDIVVTNPDSVPFEYSMDNVNWTPSYSSESINVSAGDKVYFRSDSDLLGGQNKFNFNTTSRFYIFGNMMSMHFGANFVGQTYLRTESVFRDLFNGATRIDIKPGRKLLLPATNLTTFCYFGMFNGCTSLTSAPDLPATELTSNCYTSMFAGCTSLTRAPVLPALNLQPYCYFQMFQGCASLRYLKAMFNVSEWDGMTEWAVYQWLDNGIPADGTYVMNAAAGYNPTDAAVPSTWTIKKATK